MVREAHPAKTGEFEMTDERDAVLLERVAAKDRGAFQELYQRYYQRQIGRASCRERV